MRKKKILVTGADSFIGNCLCNYLKGRNELQCTYLVSKPAVDIAAVYLDVTKPDSAKEINDLILKFAPNAIIHLIGRKLKYCESNPELAYKINYESTKMIVDVVKRTKAKIIFISSDYVFDGCLGGNKEEDRPKPILIYGKTKALSEKYILENAPSYSIVRTAGVYGHGADFYEWVVKTLQAGQAVEAFADAYFTPTYIGDLIWVFAHLAEDLNENGIFHVAGSSIVSRYEMAQKIALHLEIDPKLVKPINSQGANELIASNTTLNCDKTTKRLKRKFLSLDEGLHIMLNNKGR
jgi:dTDP-4-dehydrorhamnose reductase